MSHIAKGYKALALRHRSDRSTHHQIFVTEFTKKRSDADMPAGRTLFVLNVPPYVNGDHLAAGFTAAATTGDAPDQQQQQPQQQQQQQVVRVILADRSGMRYEPLSADSETPGSTQQQHFRADPEPRPDEFKSAYVVFRSTKALQHILGAGTREIPLYRNDRTILETGLAKWRRDYRAAAALLDERSIEAEVTEYMAAFERTEDEQRLAERREQLRLADAEEDGWQTVTKGRGAGFEQKESTLRRLEAKIDAGKKKELTNFYTFQVRDSKKQHVVGLRKRFEEDKRKIESMKQARQFRPY